MALRPTEGIKRDTVVAWYNILKAVIDGYQQKTSISHGVQKDAIQNGWDARTHRKGNGWSFSFELVENDKQNYLVMTDHGTTGLTGKVVDRAEYLEGLSKDERWAAFEGYGFTKDDSSEKQALGSRGRGKFIFVGASKENTIMYDTLTIDGNYRFGARQIQLTENTVIHFDEEKGRRKLQTTTYGIFPPLNEVGTRVIIVEPIAELVDAIKSKLFDFMIGETWWEIISKYDAKITVVVNGKERRVALPEEYDLPKKSGAKKKVWIRRGIQKSFGRDNVRVKKLHMVCEPGTGIHEDLRGIAIQRNGMKICTVEPQVLPEYIFESLYGYVILDEVGEERIKESEGLEHNDISYKKSFTRELRDWLRSEMKEFAQKELGYNPNPEKERREKQKAAERRALSAINRIAKLLKIEHLGPLALKEKTTQRGPNKPIRISMTPPVFPNPQSSRVDYGQSIGNLEFSIVNETKNPVDLNLKVYVRYGSVVIKDLADTNHEIGENSRNLCFGPIDLEVKKSVFRTPGPYILTARIVTAKTNDKLDQKSFTFYVETEPLVTGVFEDIKPEGIEEGEYQYALGYVGAGPRGGYILNYNVSHPHYIAVEDHDESLTEHLFSISAIELVKIDLNSPEPKIVKVDSHRADNIEYILERYSVALGKLLYYYRQGRK